ncbi:MULTISPECIES: hypothetical protein [unclassified Streptomyces]|uniref:hypothetical protein n=1 Tax=unclassified Streptomyces TaxID=2593676 RepID=UPI00036EC5CB|nr:MULTISPECIES: hypothetical protein [unclassified Streptomyces]
MGGNEDLVQQVPVAAVEADHARAVLSGERFPAAPVHALAERSAVEDTVQQLRGEDEAEAHLRQREAGALTLLAHATAALGAAGARRYRDVWHEAAVRQGTIHPTHA